MIGGIIGDIAGIQYEREPAKEGFIVMDNVSEFSDDTILTIALTKFLKENELTESNLDQLALMYKDFTRRYLCNGFGSGFINWVNSDSLVGYDSWGNGSAMRVSYVGHIAKTKEECLELARLSAMPTHNHIEGIKGAQAIAYSIFLAKNGKSKEEIKTAIETEFDYDLNRKIVDIKENYSFDVSCPGSVPEAIIAFLDSTDFRSAIYNAIILGGDSDTQACMAGSIAEVYYKEIPEEFIIKAKSLLPKEFIDILEK